MGFQSLALVGLGSVVAVFSSWAWYASSVHGDSRQIVYACYSSDSNRSLRDLAFSSDGIDGDINHTFRIGVNGQVVVHSIGGHLSYQSKEKLNQNAVLRNFPHEGDDRILRLNGWIITCELNPSEEKTMLLKQLMQETGK